MREAWRAAPAKARSSAAVLTRNPRGGWTTAPLAPEAARRAPPRRRGRRSIGGRSPWRLHRPGAGTATRQGGERLRVRGRPWLGVRASFDALGRLGSARRVLDLVIRG